MADAIQAIALEPNTDPNAIFASLQSSLRSYIRRRVDDDATAEDLLQDVFTKALKAISEDRAPKNLSGWLFTAARTTVIDHYRATRPETEVLDENVVDSRHNDEQQFHQELASCLRALAKPLPAIYRDTLIATDFDGKKMQSVADAQGVSLSAIKSRASRARGMLKDVLLLAETSEHFPGISVVIYI